MDFFSRMMWKLNETENGKAASWTELLALFELGGFDRGHTRQTNLAKLDEARKRGYQKVASLGQAHGSKE